MSDKPVYPTSCAVDRIIHQADAQAISDYQQRLAQLRGTTPTGLPEDNERSSLLREGFKYGATHGRADGHIHATTAENERIDAIFDERRKLLRADIESRKRDDPARRVLFARYLEIDTIQSIINQKEWHHVG